MKVIGLGSRSQEQTGRKSLFLQCNTLIDYNSGSITDRARAKICVCNIGFLAMADPMV